MSDEHNDRGYDSPELAAMGDIPPQYCTVIASEVRGDHAYVLLNTGSVSSSYLYGALCSREAGGWHEISGGNGSAWSLTDEQTDQGCLAFWDEAPPGSDAASIRYEGRDYEVPVIEGHFLLVLWGVPDAAWPQLRGFRIDGEWQTRSDRELNRERRAYAVVSPRSPREDAPVDLHPGRRWFRRR